MRCSGCSRALAADHVGVKLCSRQCAENVRVRRLRWKHRNAEKNREYARRWAQENPERNRARANAWQRQNPDRVRARQNARRARERAAPGVYTHVEWKARCDQVGGCCFYCGATGKLTVDHVVPLARGGSNSIDNIVPACSRCNCRKRHEDPKVWLRRAAAEGLRLTAHAVRLLDGQPLDALAP